MTEILKRNKNVMPYSHDSDYGRDNNGMGICNICIILMFGRD